MAWTWIGVFQAIVRRMWGLIFFLLVPFQIRGSQSRQRAMLPNFPAHVRLVQEKYSNWARTIQVEPLYIVHPDSADDIVIVATWAQKENYKLRPLGKSLGWSPFVVSGTQDCRRTIAVSSTKLNSIELLEPELGRDAVKVGTGTTMNELLEFLEKHGLGIKNVPACGFATVGGVLSGGGHGASISKTSQSGFTFGSFSNLVMSITAVVWNEASSSFELQTFHRREAETKSLIVNLGRIFITEVTLRVGPNYNLHCVSHTDIPAKELYKDPAVAEPTDRTFANLIENSDGLTAIWMVFSKNPWIRVFHEKSVKPLPAKQVDKPYAYPFSDDAPSFVSNLLPFLTNTFPRIVPILGKIQSGATRAGLSMTRSSDMWGPSKNLLLYVRPTALRVLTHSYVIITSRISIQMVVHLYINFLQALIDKYRASRQFPLNIGTELRVTGLDTSKDVGIEGAESPSLSPSTPIPSHPEFDVAIWTDAITTAGTKGYHGFAAELEHFLFTAFKPDVAIVRPEWSKGFAYTHSSAWTNTEVLTSRIPRAYSNWDETVRIFNKYDPHRVFTNELLDIIMPGNENLTK